MATCDKGLKYMSKSDHKILKTKFYNLKLEGIGARRSVSLVLVVENVMLGIFFLSQVCGDPVSVCRHSGFQAS